MRASLSGLVLILLAACSQAPVQPAPARAADSAAPAAAAQAAPPPAAQTTPPPPVLPPPAPASPPLQQVPVDTDHPLVKIQTSLGNMVVQLDAKRAPLTVKNFLTYVKERYFDGSAFYRVIPGFVIQGGDYTADLDYHMPKHKPIPFERNALANQRGSIAMAHDQNPNSANTAFFINLQDNSLQFAPYAGNPGYVVFGQVVVGMDVVDKIATLDTHTVTMLDSMTPYNDVPVKPVKIIKVTLLPMAPAGKP